MSLRKGINALVIALLAITIAGAVGSTASANLPNCSNCIEAGDIAAGAVRASELNDDLDNSITANDLATGSVHQSEIASAAVGSGEIINNSVREGDLSFNPATDEELGNSGIVTTARVTAAGVLTHSFGLAPLAETDVSYNADQNRYEISALLYFDEYVASVTPFCSTVTSWYVETASAPDETTPGHAYVYLRDAAGDPATCDFGVLFG